MKSMSLSLRSSSRRSRSALLTLGLLFACKDKPAPAPAASSTPSGPSTVAGNAAGSAPASECATRVAELRGFLTSVFDPAQHVAAPWPTGDATFDAELPKLREDVRAAATPRDPAQPVKPLTPGVTPGRLDTELASCAPAVDQLKKVADAAPDQRVTTFVGLADAIGRCDCKTDIPRVKALVYLAQRGPD